MSSGISDDVREIADELDADGGGFRTSEASALLVTRYITAGICAPDGEPKPSNGHILAPRFQLTR
jgi:hypothetical protein